MMGDTGPCGPCSEIHFNLLPERRRGRRPETASTRAQPALHRDLESRFHPVQRERRRHVLPARRETRRHRHGLRTRRGNLRDDKRLQGFQRRDPSNYAADVFAPLFTKDRGAFRQDLSRAPSRRNAKGLSEQENIDVAFRVLADHARCVSCAIADGILPGQRRTKLRHPPDPAPRNSVREEARTADRVLRATRRARRRIARRRVSRN